MRRCNYSNSWLPRTESGKNDADLLKGRHPAIRSLIEIAVIARHADTYFASSLPYGVTSSQYAVLQLLDRLGDTPSISLLADKMGVTQPTMSSTLRKLEAREWIELAPADGDRRAKAARMTEKGKMAKAECDEAALPGLRKLVSETSPIAWDTILPHLRQLRKNFPGHD